MLSLALALLLGQVQPASQVRASHAIVRWQLDPTGTGIPEDAGMVAHVTWDSGGAIHDRVASNAWATVVQPPVETKSYFYPQGHSGAPRPGVRPTNSAYFQAAPPAGAFAANQIFSGAAVINVHGPTVASPAIWSTYNGVPSPSLNWNAPNSLCLNAACVAVPPGIHVVTFGYTAAPQWCIQLDLGAMTCAASTGYSAPTAYLWIGSPNFSANDLFTVYEVYLSTQAPTAAWMTAVAQNVFGVVDQIRGLPLTDSAGSLNAYSTCDEPSGVWTLPPHIPCIGTDPVTGHAGLLGRYTANAAPWSGNIVSANYTLGAAPITGATTPAPDYNGTLINAGSTAASVNAVSGSYFATNSTVAAGNYASGSIYVAAGTATTVDLALTGLPASHCWAMGPGAVAASATVPALTACHFTGLSAPGADGTTGWTRVMVTADAAVTVPTSLLVYPETSGTGTGRTVAVWGYDLEYGPYYNYYPVQYTPTTATAQGAQGQESWSAPFTGVFGDADVHDFSSACVVSAPWGVQPTNQGSVCGIGAPLQRGGVFSAAGGGPGRVYLNGENAAGAGFGWSIYPGYAQAISTWFSQSGQNDQAWFRQGAGAVQHFQTSPNANNLTPPISGWTSPSFYAYSPGGASMGRLSGFAVCRGAGGMGCR